MKNIKKRINKLLSRTTLATQLTIIFIVIGITPVLIIGTKVIESSRDKMKDTANIYLDTITSSLSYNIDYAVDTIDKVAINMLDNQAIVEYIKEHNKGQREEVLRLKNNMENIVNTLMFTDQFLEKMYIYESGQVIYPVVINATTGEKTVIGDEYVLSEVFLVSETYEEMQKNLTNWMYIDDSIYLSKKVLYTESDQSTYIMFKIDSSYFEEVISLANIDPRLSIDIVDHTGQVILSNNVDKVGNIINENYSDYIESINIQEEKMRSISTEENLEIVRLLENRWALIIDLPYEIIFEEINQMVRAITIGVILGIIIIILISVFIARQITNSIVKLVRYMNKVEEGKLDLVNDIKENVDVTSIDFRQLKYGFINMLETLKRVLSRTSDMSKEIKGATDEVQKIAEHTAASSNQIGLAIENMATGHIEQVEYIEKSIKLMESLSQSVSNVSKMMIQVGNASHQTMVNSETTKDKLEELKEESSKTLEMTNNIDEYVEVLGEEVDNVREVIDILMNINSQTNLLSLNAAIEAARAGEAGAGFSVVAEEIRKLSLQTNESIKTFEEIISKIDEQKEQTLKEVKRAEILFKNQQPIVDGVSKTFDEIFGQMNDVNDQISSIKKDIIDVNTQKEDVSKSLIEISSIVQNASSIAQEVSAESNEQVNYAEEISKRIDELVEHLNKLNEEFKQFN